MLGQRKLCPEGSMAAGGASKESSWRGPPRGLWKIILPSCASISLRQPLMHVTLSSAPTPPFTITLKGVSTSFPRCSVGIFSEQETVGSSFS